MYCLPTGLVIPCHKIVAGIMVSGHLFVYASVIHPSVFLFKGYNSGFSAKFGLCIDIVEI